MILINLPICTPIFADLIKDVSNLRKRAPLFMKTKLESSIFYELRRQHKWIKVTPIKQV